MLVVLFMVVISLAAVVVLAAAWSRWLDRRVDRTLAAGETVRTISLFDEPELSASERDAIVRATERTPTLDEIDQAMRRADAAFDTHAQQAIEVTRDPHTR